MAQYAAQLRATIRSNYINPCWEEEWFLLLCKTRWARVCLHQVCPLCRVQVTAAMVEQSAPRWALGFWRFGFPLCRMNYWCGYTKPASKLCGGFVEKNAAIKHTGRSLLFAFSMASAASVAAPNWYAGGDREALR